MIEVIKITVKIKAGVIIIITVILITVITRPIKSLGFYKLYLRPR